MVILQYIYNDHSVCALNATESVLYILRIFQVSEELHFSSIVWNTHQVDSNPLQKQNFETSESSEKGQKRHTRAHQDQHVEKYNRDFALKSLTFRPENY